MKEIIFNEFDGLMLPSNSKDIIKEGIITTSDYILHIDVVKKAIIGQTTPERVIDNWIAINKENMYKKDIIEFLKLCIEHNYYFQVIDYLYDTTMNEFGTVIMECDLVYEYIEMPCKHPVGGKKIREISSNIMIDYTVETIIKARDKYLFNLYMTHINPNKDYLFNIRDVRDEVITDSEDVTSINKTLIESYLHKLKKDL